VSTEREITRDKCRVLEHLKTAPKFMPYLHEGVGLHEIVKLLGSRDRAYRALVALVQDRKVEYEENCSPDYFRAFAEVAPTPPVPTEPTDEEIDATLGIEPEQEQPAPPFEPGTLVAYADYGSPRTFDDSTAKLALTLPNPSYSRGQWWYGLEFVQTPEAGEPRGGAMYSETAAALRLPTSHAEILAATRYHAAARVLAARDELELAEAERDAVELAARVMTRGGNR